MKSFLDGKLTAGLSLSHVRYLSLEAIDFTLLYHRWLMILQHNMVVRLDVKDLAMPGSSVTDEGFPRARNPIRCIGTGTRMGGYNVRDLSIGSGISKLVPMMRTDMSFLDVGGSTRTAKCAPRSASLGRHPGDQRKQAGHRRLMFRADPIRPIDVPVVLGMVVRCSASGWRSARRPDHHRRPEYDRVAHLTPR